KPELDEEAICNCCKCCCGIFSLFWNGVMPYHCYTSYLAKVIDDICIGCGTCVEKCPMEAIDLLKKDISLYGPQALITLFIGVGVILGALVGGSIADLKTRRLSVYISLALTTLALLFQLIPAEWFVLLVFAFIIGASSGWSNASFSAVASEYSKKYPEATSTYYSICTSFINFGSQIGLIIMGIVFSTVSGASTDIRLSFGIIFIVMIFLSSLALIPFLLLDRKQYEYKLKEET
ncbi:unnamed protein product, partial [marine sediment metagenome]